MGEQTMDSRVSLQQPGVNGWSRLGPQIISPT
jgi:hypothetical protein